MRDVTSLDDISFTLGRLTAAQEALVERQEKADRENQEKKELLRAIKEKLDAVVEDHEWMKPQVKSYSRVRRFGGAAVSAIVTLAGIIGGSLTTFVLKKWDGG